MLYTLYLLALITVILYVRHHYDCESICGDVIIRYPFGIANHCYKDRSFAVTCNSSSSPPKLILSKLNLEVIYIGVEDQATGEKYGELVINIPWVTVCADNHTNPSNKDARWTILNMTGTHFSINIHPLSNTFVSVGCNGSASLYDDEGEQVVSCSSSCNSSAHSESKGLEVGWCLKNLGDLTNLPTSLDKLITYGVKVNQLCQSAFLISNAFVPLLDNAAIATNIRSRSVAPVVIGWDASVVDSGVVKYFIKLIVIAVGTVLVSCCCFWLCLRYKTKERRKEVRLRTKYFRGRLAEQLQWSSNGEAGERTKLYTIKELNRATENFHQNRIVGKGGQGTVYKGMLTKGQVIAVKKSTTFDESQWMPFINEVILMSQINHRNVVKLLGCCLEMKQPFLVYEFVPNGTLSQHIMASSSVECVLQWKTRVTIACDIAGAITHLHSSSSVPIYHRDIKSTNILLDEKYHAKISDFGISKPFSIDQTHVTTCVKGTFGYLDPEYFRSSQFSEKSDVYSFGVILVELLTGQPPIRSTTMEEDKSLVFYFLKHMNESTLNTILDPIVLEGCSKGDALTLANIAKQCLSPRGIERPIMRQVFAELESLRKHLSPTTDQLPQLSIEIENTLTV